MQLGARWQVGAAPHRSVPETLYPSIEEVEARHPDASSWTLTWLEGRPRCALDDVALVTINADGVPVVADLGADAEPSEQVPAEDDDDWLN